MYGAGYKAGYKVKEITHDLTFYCIHNQLCVPQYKVNIQSTWDV